MYHIRTTWYQLVYTCSEPAPKIRICRHLRTRATSPKKTFSPWTHTSDDSYIYQLSLVLATATVSFIPVRIIALRSRFTMHPLPITAAAQQIVCTHYCRVGSPITISHQRVSTRRRLAPQMGVYRRITDVFASSQLCGRVRAPAGYRMS